MLLLPVLRDTGRRHRPLATLAILLANCLVFVLFQLGDGKRYRQAESFYLESGLARMEAPLYLRYLEERGDRPPIPGKTPPDRLSEPDLLRLHRAMEADADFLERLEAGRLRPAPARGWPEWRRLRQRYTALRARVTSWRFGFRPAAATPLTAVTYMFLHGGFWHLIGNMVFLWLVGTALEGGCGRPFYAALYLLGGLAAAGLFWAAYPRSPMPLIGASGAVAGLMGAFAVLYGRRRIPVFYSLGFYFGTATVPALALFPAWVGNEIAQLALGGDTHVAYAAHVGGLAGGALLGLLDRRLLHRSDPEAFEPPPEDPVPALYEAALVKVRRLDLAGARPILEEILAHEPDHVGALRQLFLVDRETPRDPRFARTAGRLLARLARDRSTWAEAAKVWRTSRELGLDPPATPELRARLVQVFLSLGEVREAEGQVADLLRKAPGHPALPTCLL
ncbi:rhomboid family intramembrane serine protease, partial [Dissulfurirhabdus thermomarina]